MIKLIADSGSTKTAWALTGTKTKYVNTSGINPFQQTEEEISSLLTRELVPELEGEIPDEIQFYGAGCTPEKSPIVATALRSTISHEARIEVRSDMLGAARGVCGKEPGLVAILGTGSNSCLYDGNDITANVSPLGFILGDEGSGAYIGKRLVGDILKKQLPADICKVFFEDTHETAATIIQKTYREPFPNRFLASLSPFCARHRENEAIHSLLIDCFRQFFIRNIMVLSPTPSLPVNLVGSIGYYYKNEIAEAATTLGYNLGNIIKTPLEGLVSTSCRNEK